MSRLHGHARCRPATVLEGTELSPKKYLSAVLVALLAVGCSNVDEVAEGQPSAAQPPTAAISMPTELADAQEPLSSAFGTNRATLLAVLRLEFEMANHCESGNDEQVAIRLQQEDELVGLGATWLVEQAMSIGNGPGSSSDPILQIAPAAIPTVCQHLPQVRELADLRARVLEQTVATKTVQDSEREWSTCMGDMSLDYPTIASIQQDFKARFQHTFEAMNATPDDDAPLEALRAYEMRVAESHLGCGGTFRGGIDTVVGYEARLDAQEEAIRGPEAGTIAELRGPIMQILESISIE